MFFSGKVLRHNDIALSATKISPPVYRIRRVNGNVTSQLVPHRPNVVTLAHKLEIVNVDVEKELLLGMIIQAFPTRHWAKTALGNGSLQ